MTIPGPGVIIEPMATEFTLGARASCSDGLCGEVVRAILDPATKTVTHLVIEPKHRKADGRLVPVGLVEAGAGEIRLRCSMAEFDRLAASEEIDLAEGLDYDGGYGPDAVMGYGQGGISASGMGIGMGVGHQPPIVTSDNVPEGESEVVRHERVHATDGGSGG